MRSPVLKDSQLYNFIEHLFIGKSIGKQTKGTCRTYLSRTELLQGMGSDCGSFGRAVASYSSHQQKLILNIYSQLYWKDENKEKEAGNGPFKKLLQGILVHIPIQNSIESAILWVEPWSSSSKNSLHTKNNQLW